MIALPDPGDVQVATGWPEVEAFRRAHIRALDLRRHRLTLLGYYQEAVARFPKGEHDDIRESCYAQYREAAAELNAADRQSWELEGPADWASAAATERARLSVGAYSARLAAERAYDRGRT